MYRKIVKQSHFVKIKDVVYFNGHIGKINFIALKMFLECLKL